MFLKIPLELKIPLDRTERKTHHALDVNWCGSAPFHNLAGVDQPPPSSTSQSGGISLENDPPSPQNG